MPKKTKLVVNYRRGTTIKRCGRCKFFQEPDGCDAVIGNISPQGVCDLYKRTLSLPEGGFGQ